VNRRAALKNGAVDVEEKQCRLDERLPYNPPACGPVALVTPPEEPTLNENEPLSVDPRRLVAAIIIGAAILIAIIAGMGTVTFSSPGSVASVTVAPATTAPTTTAPTAAPATGNVKGSVAVVVRHLSGHTYQFRYTVRDTGRTPIGGFQINGPKSNLYHLVDPGWHAFGAGVCNGHDPNLLVYWSTSQDAANLIRPGKSARFGYDVNTSGQTAATYAISYGTAAAQFGRTQAPAASTLPASGPCS
jgi:hypothetical protein